MSNRYARNSLKKYWRVYEDAPGDVDNLGIAEGLNVISEELIEEAHSMTEDAMPPDLVDNEGRVVIDIQSGVLYEETSYSTSEEQRAYGEDASGVLGTYPDETDKEARTSVGAEAGKETTPRPTDSLKAYWRVYEDEPGDADNLGIASRASDGIQLELADEQTGGAARFQQQIIDAVVADVFSARPEYISEELVDATRYSGHVTDDESRIAVGVNAKTYIGRVRSSGTATSAEGVAHAGNKRSTEADVTSSDKTTTRSSQDENTEENINPSDQNTVDSSADGKTEDIAAVTRSSEDIKTTRSSEDENTEENINPSDKTTIDSSADGKTQDITAGNRSGEDINATRSLEDENAEENINTKVSDEDASGVPGIYPDGTDKEARTSVGAEAGKETMPRPGDSLKAYWRVYEDEPGDADNLTTEENINPSEQTTIDSSADGKTEDIAAVTRSGEDIKTTWSSQDENTEENINPSDQTTIDLSADGKTEDIAPVNRSTEDIKTTRSSKDENATEAGAKSGIGAEAGYTQDGGIERVEDETLETNTNLHVSNVEDKNAQQQQPSTSGDGNATVVESGLNSENETTDDPRRMSSALDEHTEESSEELPRINHVNTYYGNDVFTTVV